MLNPNRSQVKVKRHEALDISGTEKRGSAPESSLAAKPGSTEGITSKNQKRFDANFEMGIFCLVLFTVIVSVAAGNVEFKHHNNTEMAEVLQQIHNR